MMQEFGVKLTWVNSDGLERLVVSTSSIIGHMAKKSYGNPPDRYYRHEDSLPIFEPHHGDYDHEGYYYSENTREWVNAACQTKLHSETRQRDNKQFFTPQEEA